MDSSVSPKAKSLGIDNTFGFYFTQNSSGSILSGFNIIATDTDYAVILDKSSTTSPLTSVVLITWKAESSPIKTISPLLITDILFSCYNW